MIIRSHINRKEQGKQQRNLLINSFVSTRFRMFACALCEWLYYGYCYRYYEENALLLLTPIVRYYECACVRLCIQHLWGYCFYMFTQFNHHNKEISERKNKTFAFPNKMLNGKSNKTTSTISVELHTRLSQLNMWLPTVCGFPVLRFASCKI